MARRIDTRKLKAIAGNGTTSVKISCTPNRRIFSLQLGIYHAGGTNTMAGLMTALTQIQVFVGTVAKWTLSGTKLRDWVLLHGATFYDFDGVPNTAGSAQITLPFVPEWLFDTVGDALAWNPARLGAPITVEITSSVAITVVVNERSDDDLGADSAGIIGLEVIKPNVGSTKSYVRPPDFKMEGSLMLASIYPDSGGSNEITPASLQVGDDDVFVHEALTAAENDEALLRFGRTPAASGRTANVYDMAFVKTDSLNRAVDLSKLSRAVFTIEAASAMSGTCDILLQRLLPNPR